MSETREDRDVRLTRERVLNRVAGGDAMTRLEPVDVERFEAALEARAKARLAAAVPPLYTNAINEAAMHRYANADGDTGPSLLAEALAELGATRAALAEARERAERLGVEAADSLRTIGNVSVRAASAEARIRELEADLGHTLWANGDEVVGLLALRAEHDARKEETVPEWIGRLHAERDDARAKLAALVEAASDTRLRTHCAFQCTGGGHAPDCPTVALSVALEAARAALKKTKR